MSANIYPSRSRRMSIATATSKYETNRFGKFDCPATGCDRTGRNGFETTHALGQHRRHHHPTANGNGHTNRVTPLLDAGNGSSPDTTVEPTIVTTPAVEPTESDAKVSVVAQCNSRATLVASVTLRTMSEMQQLDPHERVAVCNAIIASNQ